MTITAIMNVFNRSHLLDKALLSLVHQSQKIDELIVSDDGSGEDILGLLKQYANHVDFAVTYIFQENKGFRLAKSRNNGIREAQGDYIIFIDQDIVGTKHYLRNFIRCCQSGMFLVAYPVRLSKKQTEQLDEEMIRSCDFKELVTRKQIRKIRSQYYKDRFYYYQRKLLKTKDPRPKLRGGVCGIFKEDLLLVDGYDEKYQGWGHEDDDLCRRLYRVGVVGQNPFYQEYPLHLYHEHFHVNGERVNNEYYLQRMKEIIKGQYKPIHGLSKSSKKNVEVIRVKGNGATFSRHYHQK